MEHSEIPVVTPVSNREMVKHDILRGAESPADFARLRNPEKMDAAVDAEIATRKAQAAVPKEKPPAKVQPPAPVEAPAAETASESEPLETDEEQDEPGKPKRKGGWQRKIERQDREIARLAAELEATKRTAGAKPDAQPEATQEPARDASAKPAPEQFETYESYIEALTDWKLEAKLEAGRQAEKESKQREAQQTKVESYLSKESEIRSKVEDYDESIEAVEHIIATPAMVSAILDSENGPAISYWLSKHPEEFKRLTTVGDLSAVRALGRIEGQIAAESSQAEKAAAPAPKESPRISKAPPPIKPVTTSRPANVAPGPEYWKQDGKASEWKALREKKAG